jgi:ABC-type dipeptide/oligopeptide/nickel transport system permease component
VLTQVANRVGQAAITLLGASVLVFVLVRIVPGDPVDLLTSPQTPLALKQQLRETLGLNRPIYIQYALFLGDAVKGDFGNSLRFQQPASALVLQRFPFTLELTLAGLGLALLVGIPLGLLAGRRPGSLADRGSMLLALAGQSIPNFWLGIVLIVIFAVRLQWLPTSGIGGPIHLILPAVTLASYNAALIARLTRSGVRDVIRQDYVRTARAKGLPEKYVLWRHTVRNALIPIITVIGLQFGVLLGGAIIVESVFAWPGIGSLLIDAIHWRDYPVVQATVLLSVLIFVLINVCLDILYRAIDPRIRYA